MCYQACFLVRFAHWTDLVKMASFMKRVSSSVWSLKIVSAQPCDKTTEFTTPSLVGLVRSIDAFYLNGWIKLYHEDS